MIRLLTFYEQALSYLCFTYILLNVRNLFSIFGVVRGLEQKVEVDIDTYKGHYTNRKPVGLSDRFLE